MIVYCEIDPNCAYREIGQDDRSKMIDSYDANDYNRKELKF